MPSRLLPGLEMTDFIVRAGYSVLPYLLCLLFAFALLLGHWCPS